MKELNIFSIIIISILLSACSSTANNQAKTKELPRNTNELVNSMISTCSGFALLLTEQGSSNYQVIFDECLVGSKRMAKQLAEKYK